MVITNDMQYTFLQQFHTSLSQGLPQILACLNAGILPLLPDHPYILAPGDLAMIDAIWVSVCLCWFC